MSKKISLVDYSECHPEECEGGICIAALACPRKILTQEAPYELPELHQTMCLGCNICATACPLKAIRISVI